MPTITMPKWVEDLARSFPGSEARLDDCGDWYLTVPMEYAAALEIEAHAGEYVVFGRAWDRTHAMSSETLVATCSTPAVAGYVVAGMLTQHDEYVKALEKAMAGDGEEV